MRQLLRQSALSQSPGEPHSLRNSSWIVRSAGLLASNGRPAYPAMRVAAAARSLDLSRHRSCSVDAIRPLSFFQLILTMEQYQKETLQAEFPSVADRVYTLSEMVGLHRDIADPISKGPQAFLATVDEITQLLHLGLDQIGALVTTRSPAARPSLK